MVGLGRIALIRQVWWEKNKKTGPTIPGNRGRTPEKSTMEGGKHQPED